MKLMLLPPKHIFTENSFIPADGLMGLNDTFVWFKTYNS